MPFELPRQEQPEEQQRGERGGVNDDTNESMQMGGKRKAWNSLLLFCCVTYKNNSVNTGRIVIYVYVDYALHNVGL